MSQAIPCFEWDVSRFFRSHATFLKADKLVHMSSQTHDYPLIGAHQSIAGGLDKSVKRAVETGCRCLQIFTRNINRWDTPAIDPVVAKAFRSAVEESGITNVIAHDSYLINPASADENLRNKSIDGLVIELERAELLNIRWVVAHPGAAVNAPAADALVRAATGIREALERTSGMKAGILVETTAGQGSCLGATFEEISEILSRVDSPRVGTCLDTCHIFAAGYPLWPPERFDETFDTFDRLVGFDSLVALHMNDSKRECGSRVDRHEGIGKGKIGSEAFGLIVNHPQLSRIPMYLETPKEDASGKVSAACDRDNITCLMSLREPRSLKTQRSTQTKRTTA